MSRPDYGTLTHTDNIWTIEAAPHVIIRIKRLFGRASNRSAGSITVKATPDVAEDLEWILDRWPLTISRTDRAYLAEQAEVSRVLEATVRDILNGYQRPTGDRTPVRPFRGYQITAGDLCHATGRLLLADDLGLGKSTTAVTLFRDPETLPAVIVAPTHLATPGVRPDGEPRSQWHREIRKSYPDLNVHVAKKGTPPARLDAMPDVIILNYHKLAGWARWLISNGVTTSVFDEVQELRRSTSDKYHAAKMLADECRWRIGASATPIYNYGGELWNVMNVIAPDELGTREEFGREWCGRQNGMDDKTIVGDMAALSEWMTDRGLMLRRTRKHPEVRRELPPVEPIVHQLPADEATIASLADADFLAASIVAGDLERFERGRVAAEFDMRIRQATGLAKAPYVAEFVRMLLSNGPVVLFGWHRGVYDIWAEQLADLNPQFYTGTESPRQKDESVNTFLSGGSDLLVVSLRSGAGLDGLQVRSSQAVFGEFDWSPGVHAQCVGRLARDGQTEPVTAFYLATDYGSDPTVLSVLGVKQGQSDDLLEPDGAAFTMSQVDPGRVRRLAEHWLESRKLDAERLVAERPLAS